MPDRVCTACGYELDTLDTTCPRCTETHRAQLVEYLVADYGAERGRAIDVLSDVDWNIEAAVEGLALTPKPGRKLPPPKSAEAPVPATPTTRRQGSPALLWGIFGGFALLVVIVLGVVIGNSVGPKPERVGPVGHPANTTTTRPRSGAVARQQNQTAQQAASARAQQEAAALAQQRVDADARQRAAAIGAQQRAAWEAQQRAQQPSAYQQPSGGQVAGACPKGGGHVPGKTDPNGKLHCAKCGQYM